MSSEHPLSLIHPGRVSDVQAEDPIRDLGNNLLDSREKMEADVPYRWRKRPIDTSKEHEDGLAVTLWCMKPF